MESEKDELKKGAAGGTRIISSDEIRTLKDEFKGGTNTLIGEAVAYYHKLLIKTEDTFDEYDIKEESTVIGRTADSSIPISDGTVSGYHTVILVKGDECILRDLESKNGTFIYDYEKRQWEIVYQQRLQKYDKIKIGSHRFMFIPGGSAFSLKEINRRFKDEPLKDTATKILAVFCGVILITILILLIKTLTP
ncbi:MAG: hypothetical protein DRI57_09500 [Deltaproteobacteria bacterium]|nr:MAG: hypothetical protein DRI57_09500 [Deltaproteobacteria bacterium]